jgi:hypothetical protein
MVGAIITFWRRCQHVPALFLLMIMVFWLLGAPKRHDHEVGGGMRVRFGMIVRADGTARPGFLVMAVPAMTLGTAGGQASRAATRPAVPVFNYFFATA